MDFIQIFSGEVKTGKFRELKEWLAANEARIAEETPEGAEYMGTYFAAHSSEKSLGGVFTLVRMESYGTQDTLAAATDGPYAELLGEFVDFFDQESDNWGNFLLKRFTDATIWGSDA